MGTIRRAVAAVAIAVAAAARVAAAVDLGPNVVVFDPSMPAAEVQRRADAVFAKQEQNQFGPDRVALLFKPGTYRANVRVGFYTQVMGLGSSPDDVRIDGGIGVDAGWFKGNATCNFWRSAEHLSVRPSKGPMVWAVSQGTALRGVHVLGDVNLWDGGWSSGGYLADSRVDGAVTSGSQQQWFSRNADWGQWRGGNWNMVFVGCGNPPAGAWPKQPYTTLADTPRPTRGKPYLTVDGAGELAVRVPKLQPAGTRGAMTTGGDPAVPLDQFHVARPGRDTADTINAALSSGKHLLLTPGVYHLDAPIHVTRAGTVVLALGYATLIPDRGTPAVAVDDVDGVTLAGLVVDAGTRESPTLVEVGPAKSDRSHAADPTLVADLVCRSGGASAGRCQSFVTVNSRDAIGDNLWLWRADHGAGAGWATNPTANGLVVNGDDVTMYGLFVEHCQQYQTLWTGERGRTFFYQSELPYDVPSQAAWSHDGKRGWASYKVADTVRDHQAQGLGVYAYFTAAPAVLDAAVEVPPALAKDVRHVITVRLGGKDGSGIAHPVNDRGEPVITQFSTRLD